MNFGFSKKSPRNISVGNSAVPDSTRGLFLKFHLFELFISFYTSLCQQKPIFITKNPLKTQKRQNECFLIFFLGSSHRRPIHPFVVGPRGARLQLQSEAKIQLRIPKACA